MKNYFEMVASMPEFANYQVYSNKNGTIIIKVAERGTNVYNFRNANERYGIQYQLGHSNGQYWVRQRNGDFIWPMHYDKYTGKYGFETFEAAFAYFMKYWHKKYGSK